MAASTSAAPSGLAKVLQRPGAWDRQLTDIGRSFRAIAYSRRFARPNEPIDPEASDSLLGHVEDLVTLLRELDAKPAHLVGNSYGALTCLVAGLRHPDAVRSLVLEEPPAITLFAPTISPRPADLLHLVATRPRTAIALFRFVFGTIGPAQRAFERGDDDDGLWIFARGVLGQKPLEEIPEALREQMRENRNDLRALMLHPEPEPPPLDAKALREMRVPVLLATGELSPPVLLRLTDRLEELLPTVERIEIPDASHFMHVENPSVVNEAIVEFARRRSEDSTPAPVA